MKLKKGDKVSVIAGKSKGQTGTITRVMPRENKVVIDGINIVKRHRKPTAQSQVGQIIEKAMPIHVSNVMIVDPKSGKPSRIKIVRSKDGARERIVVKSSESIK